MDFNFTEEQQLLADTVRRFVRESYSFEHRREILKANEGWSRDAWNELAGNDPDLFVEVVRFEETRNYIRAIYEIFGTYRSIYSPVQ